MAWENVAGAKKSSQRGMFDFAVAVFSHLCPSYSLFVRIPTPTTITTTAPGNALWQQLQ
jgi:hypothetical protein